MKKALLQRLPLAMGLAFLAVGLTAGAGQAQYPPPSGSVTLTAQGSGQAGDSMQVTASVRDASGAPVGGIGCTFTIAEQPGNDAAVQPGPIVTDAAGNAVASLNTGSTPGNIVVDTMCGTYSGRVLVSVVGAESTGSEAPTALPSTGYPRTVDSNYLGLAGLALVLLGACFVGAGLAARRRS